MRTLVLGGARSGKSVFAEDIAGPGPVVYVATARPWPGDQDFAERIAIHAGRRPDSWTTEDTTDLVELLGTPVPGTMLVDDLGTWLTTATDRCGVSAWEQEVPALTARIRALTTAVAAYEGGDLILVSPEVGMGVIPEHRSGRVFRDRIGTLNQEIAGLCDRVVLVVAGQALELKRF
ncbi:bifunctional adenosylcobinamide kinase/adenosylcobinamide-phosphate guanylyltransferase [Corynebacterium pacaense]|uniref:bifunctional adenosylcobinamide kinase/adenosylcobinamide-phosphate guanylyltransferase n=1 Tax=Corynebacterium pacaense TaxID=1816684 RepID=UPI0009BB7C2F|nr:bifunctional adenosylcobinamide kinase/adenosylcobinamide-phosphate guanylyltransferase [Corynebacterium pacaense]